MKEYVLSSSTPKRHHYIPLFFLQGFVRDHKLWVYDLEKRVCICQTPKNSFVKKHYYSYEQSDGQKDALVERILGDIEAPVKPIMDKLASGKAIDQEEKIQFAVYLALQYCRVPVQQEMFENSRERFYRHVSEAAFANEDVANSTLAKMSQDGIPVNHVTAKSMVDFVFRNMKIKIPKELIFDDFFSVAEVLSEVFFSKIWNVCHASSKRSFVVTDNPIITVVQNNDPNYNYPVGMASDKATQFIPLDAKHCMFMNKYGDGVNHVEIGMDEIRKINLALVSKSKRFFAARDKPLLISLVREAFPNSVQ